MISGIRMLRRGGTSLLAAACLVTACSGPTDDPEGDVPGDDAAAADTATDDHDVNDIEADDIEADDIEADDTDERNTSGTDDGGTHDPLPRFVTQNTPDGTYTMSVDDSATLELPQGTASPAVTGTAVEVFDVASLADSGVAQWEIRAIEPGESTITATVDGRSHTWTIAVD